MDLADKPEKQLRRPNLRSGAHVKKMKGSNKYTKKSGQKEVGLDRLNESSLYSVT